MARVRIEGFKTAARASTSIASEISARVYAQRPDSANPATFSLIVRRVPKHTEEYESRLGTAFGIATHGVVG